jgi:hypothetical protein
MANKLKEFITSKKLKLTEDHVLVLRKTAENGVTKKGFVYPSKGQVEAPDWDGGIKKCGGGLHGLAWAEGELDIDNYGVFFQVILVDKKDGFINLDGNKCKYRKGEVVLTTRDRYLAISFIKKYDNIHARKINYDHSYELVANQGYDSTANQEGGSIANQGYGSTANQGYGSTANQGNGSTANQEGGSTANQGKKSAANQGVGCTANQGDGSVSIARLQSNSTHVHRVSENCVTVLYDDSGKPHIFSGYANKALYFYDCKIKKEYTSTPEEITSLESWEIFVFGSNLAGKHDGGAARIAQENFSAESGVGEGRTGQSYAFPTLSQNGAKVTKEEIKESIGKLIKYANGEPNRMFLVTKVGCGIAGFDEEYMSRLFKARKDMPANIVLPKGWAHWD